MSKTDFAVGELIEQRYRVIAPIGAGGMGTLYRVADVGRGSVEVALKMVRLNMAGISAAYIIRQFQREFQLLTQLQHPNLVQVFNYGATAGGDFFYTMEYIDGRDLAKGMHDLGLEFLLPIMVQICRGLGYLHAREVMHGDLKPANVLLSGEQIKIVDFGLAHDLRFESESPQYITPFYAAPEVGKGHSVDGRADLYSLGAMLYEGIVGETPAFMVGAERLIRMTLRERLASQAVIPAGIDVVVLRLLAKDPKQRYNSANQVIEGLNITTGSTYELETRETASSYALRASFLGREAEIENLMSLWQAAWGGQAGLVLIGGESGVGKTRLVEELEVQVELSGARVVWGQCLESGGTAYQPWREVLRVLIRYVENVESLDLKRVGPVLAAILPELWGRPYMSGISPPAELEPQAAQQRLNNAILQVLLAVAQIRPTLIVIDDAHWGDEASLEMLRYLGRVLGNHGLLVCVTYRSDEIVDEHVLVELGGEQVQRILLETLLAEDTQQLVRSMLGLAELPPELAQRVQDTTGGNTFFVQELIRSLAEQGQVLQRTVTGWQVDQAALQAAQLPGSIQQVIWRRLEQLSERAQQVLSYAAVVGPLFWDGAIAHVGGADADADWVRAALSEAMERELVVLRDESAFGGEREYLFVKAAMQEVSYESLAQEQRQESHARVAEWLMARPDEQVDEHLGLIAEHLLGAEQTVKARNFLRRAGEKTAEEFASAEAIGYFTRAIELTPEEEHVERYSLLLAREKVYGLQGARQDQAQDLATLQQLVELLDDYQRQAEVSLRLVIYAEAISNYQAGIAAVQDVIALAQDASVKVDGYLKWGTILWRQGNYQMARFQVEQGLALVRTIGERRLEGECLHNLGYISYLQGDLLESKSLSQQALDIFREIGDRPGEGQALHRLCVSALNLNDFSLAGFYSQQALLICQDLGDRRLMGDMFSLLGVVDMQIGEYTQAGIQVERSLFIHREIDDRQSQSLACDILGVIFRRQGEYERARNYYEQGYMMASEIGSKRIIIMTLNSLSRLHHCLGDDQTALEYSERGLALARQIGSAFFEAQALACQSWAIEGLGQLAEATTIYLQALALQQETGQHHLVPETLAGLARVSLAQGDLAQARVHTDEILNQVNGEFLSGAEEPFDVYLTCYHILQASQDSRAGEILRTTHRLLQTYASKIDDEKMRRSFLENVVAHREIISAYNQRLPDEN